MISWFSCNFFYCPRTLFKIVTGTWLDSLPHSCCLPVDFSALLTIPLFFLVLQLAGTECELHPSHWAEAMRVMAGKNCLCSFFLPPISTWTGTWQIETSQGTSREHKAYERKYRWGTSEGSHSCQMPCGRNQLNMGMDQNTLCHNYASIHYIYVYIYIHMFISLHLYLHIYIYR